MIPIVTLFEKGKLLQTTESKELILGHEISRIHLVDLLDVTRAAGENGSHRDPGWLDTINSLGNEMDDTIADVMGEQTLVDMPNLAQKKNRKKPGRQEPAIFISLTRTDPQRIPPRKS